MSGLLVLILLILFGVIWKRSDTIFPSGSGIVLEAEYDDLISGKTIGEEVEITMVTRSRRRHRMDCNEIGKKNLVSYTEMSDQLQSSPRRICNCSWWRPKKILENKGRLKKMMLVQSTCSVEATLLGSFQKVISYSLFKPINATAKTAVDFRYFQGIMPNLLKMSKLYPGWVMRIYSDVPLRNELCDVVCSHQDIYYCDVNRLPVLGNVSELNPMTWRFLLLGDGTVEKFAVRDLDSRLSQRERDAVNEWERSPFPFHGMRDDTFHQTQIMGGMWGGDNYKLCLATGAKIRKELMMPLWEKIKCDDQQIIRQAIYFKHKDKILTHDSYTCHMFQDSRPFPTQRQNNQEHVGRRYYDYNLHPLDPCPLECRPEYGVNWEYC